MQLGKLQNHITTKLTKEKQREKVSYPRIYSKTAVFLCQTREIYCQNINRRKAILGFGELLYIMDLKGLSHEMDLAFDDTHGQF
jgi:hypothetical protein